MSTRLVGTASRFLDARTSRRGFLRRAALVGTALVAAPATYILRPLTAQAAILPVNCGPFDLCNDGWTDFCVNTSGVNTCPPGSLIGGWWRAEGNTFCGGKSRYYMDCHSSTCSCGCDASGTCDHTCTGVQCHCNHDNCNERKVGCTRFRYGQCNNHHKCIGPITCRVVTCVPPWEWDTSCTKTDAVAQVTYTHDAPGLHPDIRPKGPYQARPAVLTGAGWQLGNTLTGGAPSSSFTFGRPGDVPVIGDFSNAGVRTVGMVRNQRHGVAGTEGSLKWFLRLIEGPGEPDMLIEYGRSGDIPVVGDWNGNGVHTIGVVRGNRWLLKNSNRPGPADLDFVFGQPGDIPVVGDWNSSGRSSIGMVRGNRWLLSTSLTGGPASIDFFFAGTGTPVTGDWTGNGATGVGWFSSGTWQIRNGFSSGAPADSTFEFGNPQGIPLTWGRVI